MSSKKAFKIIKLFLNCHFSESEKKMKMSFTEIHFLQILFYMYLYIFIYIHVYINSRLLKKHTKASDLSVWIRQKCILTWDGMLPARILIFLAVNERAGLQLAAHYRGAVVTHGRVPGGALWFRVTVNARDWRERKSRTAVSQMGGHVARRRVTSEREGASSRGGEEVLVRAAGREKDHSYQSYSETAEEFYSIKHLDDLIVSVNMNWKAELWFPYSNVKVMTNKHWKGGSHKSWNINTAWDLCYTSVLSVQNPTEIHSESSHQCLITLSTSIRTLPVRWRCLRVTADWLERSHKAKRAWQPVWQPAYSPRASKTFQQCGCSHR